MIFLFSIELIRNIQLIYDIQLIYNIPLCMVWKIIITVTK